MRIKFLVTMVTIVLMSISAFAVGPSGTSLINGSEYGPITIQAPGTQNVTAGHIQYVSLETNQSTLRWAGLTGNVSGTIQLGDGASVDVMYTWAASGNIVYACEDTPNWDEFNGTSTSDVDATYTYLNGSYVDNVTNTFNESTTSTIGSTLFPSLSVNASTAFTLDNESNPSWVTYVLTDGTGKFIFAGKVNETVANFRGDIVDFQMIVPEDGTSGNTAATEYKLWVELI